MSHGRSGTLFYFLLALSFLSCERVCKMSSGETIVDSSSGGAGNQHEETLRKEMIKVQILQRLGLVEKPLIDNSHKLSKDLALALLSRTDNFHQSSDGDLSTSDVNNSTTTQTEDDNNFAKTSEIISFPDKGPILNGHTLLSFSYAGNNAYGVGVRVKKAHLWVKMDYRSSMGRHFGHLLHPNGVNLYIFHIAGNSKKTVLNHTVNLTSQDVQMDLVLSQKIMLDALGWQKLDITSVVQKWYNKNSRHRIRHGSHHQTGKNHPREKLTLLVDCAGCANSIQPITFSQSNAVIVDRKSSEDTNVHQQQNQLETSEESFSSSTASNSSNSSRNGVGDKENANEVPFLVLETETAPNSKRSRRRALECSPRVKHCCKQRFYVDFHELGWDDWIIAPKGYWANYCKGHCGGPWRTPDTFLNYHSHVLNEYKATQEGQSNLEGVTPCCAPTKFAPMSLIYFGPDYNIIKRDLPKMIVEECGCP